MVWESSYSDNSFKRDSNDYLEHHGIKGQKWGVRRFQNEDGTLTKEGRAKYLDGLTSQQKAVYNALAPSDQRRFDRKLASGKSFDRVQKEEIARAVGAGLATTAGLLYLSSPATRSLMKATVKMIASAGKAAFRAAKNSNLAQRGSMWLKKTMNRRTMVKNGGVVLNKSQYSVKDAITKFGGYLR